MVTVSTSEAGKAYHHGDLRAAAIETGLALLETRTADDLGLREIARTVAARREAAAEAERLRIARELHDTPIEIALPTVDNSLAAIAAARDAAAEEDEQDAPAPGDSLRDAAPSPAVAGAV